MFQGAAPARTLDNKDWQALWMAMADWKTPFETMQSLAKYGNLSADGKKMVQQACAYYETGAFPAVIASAGMPSLLVSQTLDQRSNPERPITPPISWNFNGLPR
ncbi:effector protein Tle3 domain-containing protein [Burkholderia gladioli]|uniref:effector protein Tle3 domain-containing protein n=1 Tax=Burkholderia gladioli TaxID=28095 RepID=UPI002445E4C9|nr:DUF3274 domain-containing protein [Burkholderia gladioli]